MKPLQAQIEKFSHDARGIARINGKITFIDGALPGERVTYVLYNSKKHYDEARVIEVLQASSWRVVPACRYYGLCGGCSLQHLADSKQLEVKQTLVLELLERVARISPRHLLSPLASQTQHYRAKARFSVQIDSSGVALGFKQKHQPNLTVSIDQCLVLNKAVEGLLPPLRACLQSLDSVSRIKSLELAVGEEATVLIVREQLPLSDSQRLQAFAATHGIRLVLHTASDDYLTYSLPAYQLVLRFHPTDFTQINPAMNRLMIAQALELLELNRTDVVLDLFCGIGNFTLPMARCCQQVIGIEGLASLVARAEMNAEMNGIDNAVFHAGNLERMQDITTLSSSSINKVLLDPPRGGALAVVKQMSRINPERVLYISCDAATFARDAAELTRNGYMLHTLGVMDMFPHTAHIETMALFLKKVRDGQG